MKLYSHDKFKALSRQRQAQILLDCLYQIDKNWSNFRLRNQFLQNLDGYLNGVNWREAPPEWTSLRPFMGRDLSDLSLRRLLDLAVPLERYLEIAIKDEHILAVTSQDRATGVERPTLPIFFVLDHLRSGFNVGSLFRTADCLGVAHIYLVGYTPAPQDKQVQKTAMGAESWIPYSQHNSIDEVVDVLQNKNIQILGLETSDQAQDLNSVPILGPVALVVGNERFGLSQKTLGLVDKCVYLPMQGFKNSMNVANLLSVVTYEVTRQLKVKV